MGDRLRAELLDLTAAFNCALLAIAFPSGGWLTPSLSTSARITYFANLQKISDDVADPDMDHKSWRGLLVELESLRQEERASTVHFPSPSRPRSCARAVAVDHKADIESKQSRRRYLENLNAPEDRDADAADEEKTCPICADTFTKGVLTNCGHLTCMRCFRAWSSIKRSCALCKQDLAPGSYQTVLVRHALFRSRLGTWF